MPRPKADFEALYPCDFYRPAEVLDEDRMYTVPEIARRLQDLSPEAELDPTTEDVLIDWAIPWIVRFGDELVVADPEGDGPGYYGVRTD